MDAPPREGRNSKLCLLSSALSSASMLVSKLASVIRALELVGLIQKMITKIYPILKVAEVSMQSFELRPSHEGASIRNNCLVVPDGCSSMGRT